MKRPGSAFRSGTAVVPKGTPREIVVKLNAAIADALADATVRKRLTDIGQEIFPREQRTPEALYAFHKAETEKWWPIIKAAALCIAGGFRGAL
jgi:tripartite-type tricarboxylate transporter receptor subunit TctC